MSTVGSLTSLSPGLKVFTPLRESKSGHVTSSGRLNSLLRIANFEIGSFLCLLWELGVGRWIIFSSQLLNLIGMEILAKTLHLI